MKKNKKKIGLIVATLMLSCTLFGCEEKEPELGDIKIIDEKEEVANTEESDSFDFKSNIDDIFNVTEKYKGDYNIYDFIDSYNNYMGTTFNTSAENMISSEIGNEGTLHYLMDETKQLYFNIDKENNLCGSGTTFSYKNQYNEFALTGTNPDFSEFKKTTARELLALSYITIPNINKYELTNIYDEYSSWIDTIDLSKQETESKDLQRKGYKILFSRKGDKKVNISITKV